MRKLRLSDTAKSPWENRKPVKLAVMRKFKIGRVHYDLMSDGSRRNIDHERHERRVLELSARQHRRRKKQYRREAKKAA